MSDKPFTEAMPISGNSAHTRVPQVEQKRLLLVRPESAVTSYDEGFPCVTLTASKGTT